MWPPTGSVVSFSPWKRAGARAWTAVSEDVGLGATAAAGGGMQQVVWAVEDAPAGVGEVLGQVGGFNQGGIHHGSLYFAGDRIGTGYGLTVFGIACIVKRCGDAGRKNDGDPQPAVEV